MVGLANCVNLHEFFRFPVNWLQPILLRVFQGTYLLGDFSEAIADSRFHLIIGRIMSEFLCRNV